MYFSLSQLQEEFNTVLLKQYRDFIKIHPKACKNKMAQFGESVGEDHRVVQKHQRIFFHNNQRRPGLQKPRKK